MAEEKAKMSLGKKIVIALIIILVLMTAAAYSIGVYYFSEHFFPGSMVNGLNCSYMTADEAEGLLAKRIDAYALQLITWNNGQEGITAEQAGLAYTPDGSVQKFIDGQGRYKWFLAFNQQRTYETPSSSSYDEEKLRTVISGLQCMQNVTEPSDAYIQETDEGYTIVEEVVGNAPDSEKVLQAVAEAMCAGRTELNLEEAGCYKKPAVYSDDERLVKDCQQMNALTDVIITYDFGDRAETVDRSLISTWLTRDENQDYILDEVQIAAYVKELGSKYDTVGNVRTFRTYDEREKTITGGDYGWIIDQEGETQALMEAIESGVTQVREPVYAQSGWSRDTNDIGYTYIEIDLTNQRMVLYIDGYPTVDTPVVTGNPSIPGSATPTGCYTLYDMKSPATVTAGTAAAQTVNFWMAFTGNVGICDAPQRTEFGGNMYLLEGSGGCVDTPYDQAQMLYSHAEIGMPVIVYE